jgi:hypothetical protein
MTRVGSADLYRRHDLAAHSAPGNIALHVLATLARLASLPATLLSPWLLLLPVVHAAPGLLGHRLFERSAAVATCACCDATSRRTGSSRRTTG